MGTRSINLCLEQETDNQTSRAALREDKKGSEADNSMDNSADNPTIADGRLTRCRLGDFFKQDVVNPVLLPLYPSSQPNTNYPLRNLTKYRTLEYPFYTVDMAAVKALKYIAAIGAGVPVVVFEIPRKLDAFKAHWSRWIPRFEECTDIIVLNDKTIASIDNSSLFMLLPSEQIPAEKHTMNPDTFYEIYSKFFIPEVKIQQPKDIRREEAKAPCVVKIPVSQGRNGVKMATTDQQILEFEEWATTQGWKGELVYQELVPDVKVNLGIQGYILKDGTIVLGCISYPFFNSMDCWVGAIYCRTPEEEALNLRLTNFCHPALKKLHEKGYFGYFSFDIVENSNGELFLVDINPRLGGSNPHMSMMDDMADRGYPVSMFDESLEFTITIEEMISRADQWNESNDSVVIVLGARETADGTLLTAISFFAKNKDDLVKTKENAINFFKA